MLIPFALISLMTMGALSVVLPIGVESAKRDSQLFTDIAANEIQLYMAGHSNQAPENFHLVQEWAVEKRRVYRNLLTQDRYGRPWIYKKVGARGFEIRSSGKDGVPGNEDDTVRVSPSGTSP